MAQQLESKNYKILHFIWKKKSVGQFMSCRLIICSKLKFFSAFK